MKRHDIKLLLDLVLRYLVLTLQHFGRLFQSSLVLIQHYFADVVARTPFVLKLSAWMDRLTKHPWFRQCRIHLYHCGSFIVGSSYEDERVAFTAQVLVKNDAYRDRLLVPEIEDLVVLCDALHLTLPQRKAYFQCFLHVDYMRRSSVSRAELLRYCSLRCTPLTSFLLPTELEPTHRDTAGRRWDIMQLMAACFSVCTAEIAELVRLAVDEAIRPEVDDSDREGSTQEEVAKEESLDETMKGDKQTNRGGISTIPGICQQIDRCLAFFIGVPDPVENRLRSLLFALYGGENFGGRQKTDVLTTSDVSFLEIHRVATIFDVVRLFPVLIFPCIWTQRVLRARILGHKTWQCLQQRRVQLRPHLPAESVFLPVADIIAASQVQLQLKPNRGDQLLTPKREQPGVNSRPTSALLDGGGDDSTNSTKSTPRKVVPCIGSELVKPTAETSLYALEASSNLELTFDGCSTSDEAWRISANHALASVYIQCICGNTTMTSERLQAEFEQVTAQIFAGELCAEKADQIHQRLVKVYGYRFAHSLLAKSNVKELIDTSKTPLDERRAKRRYAKAWCGSGLVEDKLIYWKEFEDPVANRAFYYNVRTGESKWEMPADFVGKKKAKRRRKAGSTKAQPQHMI